MPALATDIGINHIFEVLMEDNLVEFSNYLDTIDDIAQNCFYF